MNLPFILDIIIGLIFVYLILSLLASEIQELITTLLQWRASHLKKSIEILLSGESNSEEETKVIDLVNQLYSSPLIKNINQEAKGWFDILPRKFTWMLGNLYRSMKTPKAGVDSQKSMFGNRKSGPSYISSETFASTLLETLQIPTIIQKFSESRLEKFKQERLIKEIEGINAQLKASFSDSNEALNNAINNELSALKIGFNKITNDYRLNKASLETTLERMADKLDRYIANSQANLEDNPETKTFLDQLESLREDTFGRSTANNKPEMTILLRELKPTLTEVVATLKIGSAAHKEIESTFQNKEDPVYQGIAEAIRTLPESVRESLEVLANRAESKVSSTEEDINQLRHEVENWFDRSMDRASGVYKRNAKGVAILIGFFIACVANADTLHIVSRLAKDSAIRTTITQNAGQIVSRNNGVTDLKGLRDEANDALTDIALPIGWTSANLEQQIGWKPEQPDSFPFLRIFKMIPGWILSAIAIAMGAPFWFDLLSKVVNVRNAGKPPVAASQKSDSDNS